MTRSQLDVWAVVGGELGQDDAETGAKRRSRPVAPSWFSDESEKRSPLETEIGWATRQDGEVDAEAIPLARSLRWLRGESPMPNEEERALDDAFLSTRREHERARRARVARRIVALVAGAAALAALAPLARALL